MLGWEGKSGCVILQLVSGKLSGRLVNTLR